MKLKDRQLVVARIISGRNFPNKNGYQIMAEAKFNGHVLSIDPVNHSDCPLFEQELAWELDKKCLHQHKLQRSCLKIQFFATNNQSPVKEFVGYILMDLRSISTNQVHKYQTLLHSKYSTKPEIFCGIYLDEDGQEIITDDCSKEITIDPKLLKPKLIPEINNNASYYLIGPDKFCKSGFLLSIVITEANNLTYLIPSDIPISKSGDNSFYLYYDLFGNSILTEKFTDLVNPVFHSERTSANILSNVDLLKMYFNNLKYLSVHLCCNKHSLGVADIPINSLLKDIDHQFQTPAILENTYQLHSPNSKQTRKTADDDGPTVKLSIILQRVEEFQKIQTISSIKGNKLNQNEQDCISNRITPRTTENHNLNNNNQIRNNHFSSNANVQMGIYQHDDDKRHLCYTIELRSIRSIQADHTKRIYTRYVYPMFGSAAPIMTHPPVEIRREQDVILPQGYCAFEFGAAWKSLEKKLFNNPLIVEVYERDKIKDSDTCIGIGKIPLSKVLSSSCSKTQHKGHLCLKYSSSCEIISVNDNSESVIGELIYNLSIEDFGPFKTSGTRVTETKRSITKESDHSGYQSNEEENKRSTREYQIALELELWKEAEEAAFISKLKEKENQTMLSLAEEWRKRDKEREILVKKKVTEYEELEKALRTTMVNLAQRERQLAAGETELQRLRTELESEANRKANEFKDASRRMEQDCEHRSHLLSEHLEHWKLMAHDWQQKAQQTEREFTQYRNKQNHIPETKLQAEINALHSEKMKLEEALEASTRAKENYKKQWVRAINEVARLKQKNEKLSKDHLRKQEEELGELKMKYRTIDNTAGTASQLESIKHELDKLREEAQNGIQDGTVQTTNDSWNSTNVDMSKLDDATASRVIKLIEERDMLLRTGLYTSHDPVINELDRELRKMMESCSH